MILEKPKSGCRWIIVIIIAGILAAIIGLLVWKYGSAGSPVLPATQVIR